MSRKAPLKMLYPLKGDLSWSEKDQDCYFYTKDEKYKVILLEVYSKGFSYLLPPRKA
jgi:hypothetical protein